MAKIKLQEKKTETEMATQAAKNQFASLETIAQHEQTKVEATTEKATEGRKDKLVTFNLSVAEYENYKKWFGSKGMSFSLGLRMCLDYIYYQDQAEKIILSKSGIRENELLRLK